MSVEKRITLRDLIQAEGVTTTTDSIPTEVVEAAERYKYAEGMRLVIQGYKPLAKRRFEAKRFSKNGENLDRESVEGFRELGKMFAVSAILLSRICPVTEALLLHNAALCMSKGNGNQPERQKVFNLDALAKLESVPEVERDDDWQVVFEKVFFGLSEAGHIEFDAIRYEATIKAMPANSTDLASRRTFLARKWVQAGNLDEAIRVLLPVGSDVYSAPSQIESAKKLLEKYLAQKANCI